MQSSPSGPVRDRTGSGSTAAPRQRWAWTYRYGTPLFVTAVVAVVLSGSALAVTVLALGGNGGGNGNGGGIGSSSVAPSPPADCEVGTWRAVVIEEDIDTGELELIEGEEPAFVYREDGTGEIDFGERTAFLFYGRLFGEVSDPAEQYLTGALRFTYESTEDTIRHSYVDITDGAQMIADPLPIPNVWYVPRGDSFEYECDAETMTLDADSGDYYVELRRDGS